MESLKALNMAMEYIDSHLDREIDFQKVSQLACCSEYHFRRIFSFLSGMALSEYIRYRRLSQAALDLQNSKLRVIDLAVKYGYESADAFSRAFQTLHGISPSEARAEGTVLKAIPPMRFQLTIQGGNEMDYRIIEKEAFQLIGLKKRVSLRYEGVNPEIAAMWESLTEDEIKALKALSQLEPRGLISASVNFAESRAEGTEFEHFIGVASQQSQSEKWHILSVAASTWAVFTAKGKFPDELQRVWAQIYAEWFSMSGYEISEGPEILWNEGKDTSLPNYRSEIWIPVVKK